MLPPRLQGWFLSSNTNPFVIPSEVEESLAIQKIFRDVSTSLDMTEMRHCGILSVFALGKPDDRMNQESCRAESEAGFFSSNAARSHFASVEAAS
jgi:hypothetical protein